jgi:hypothetical protein
MFYTVKLICFALLCSALHTSQRRRREVPTYVSIFAFQIYFSDQLPTIFLSESLNSLAFV